jgi:hypothetical protein
MMFYAFLGMAVLLMAGWLLRRGERIGNRREARREDIDWNELRAAEREVQHWDASVRPDDDAPGADWGPGTGKPRPPELL